MDQNPPRSTDALADALPDALTDPLTDAPADPLTGAPDHPIAGMPDRTPAVAPAGPTDPAPAAAPAESMVAAADRDGRQWPPTARDDGPVRRLLTADGPIRPLLAGLGRDSAYLLLGLPVTIASFTVLITGVSLAAGLLITVAGIPIAVGTLHAAVGFEWLERARLAAQGTVLEPVHYAPKQGTGLRGMFSQLADPRRWAAVVHGIGAHLLAVLTWSIAVTWWTGTVSGLTYWYWERWLPNDPANTTLAELLNLSISDSLLNLMIGMVFAATIIPVLRWCVNLHVGWARLLLTGSSRRALAAQVESLEARRSAASAAETQSLRKLERDIHDGPQQRLVRLGMDLSVAERRLDDDPAAARELLAAARAQTAETLAELRALSRGIAPPVLADRGLAAALAAVAARSTVPTSVDVQLPDGARPAPAIESAAYFLVTEALTNTAKHAGATLATVRVWTAGDENGTTLGVEVRDDGSGGAEAAKGHGLAGLADRVEGLGGLLTVTSPEGGPTVLRATLPWF